MAPLCFYFERPKRNQRAVLLAAWLQDSVVLRWDEGPGTEEEEESVPGSIWPARLCVTPGQTRQAPLTLRRSSRTPARRSAQLGSDTHPTHSRHQDTEWRRKGARAACRPWTPPTTPGNCRKLYFPKVPGESRTSSRIAARSAGIFACSRQSSPNLITSPLFRSKMFIGGLSWQTTQGKALLSPLRGHEQTRVWWDQNLRVVPVGSPPHVKIPDSFQSPCKVCCRED